MKKINLVTTTLFLMFSCFGLSGCDILDGPKIKPIYNDLGQIQTQISSDQCDERNYKTTLGKLQQAGFKNFKINFIGDIIIGLFASEDAIDSIRINEVSKFDKDTYFNVKSVVFMDVHSSKPDLQLITETIDGQLPILYSSNSFKGTDKLVAGEKFTNIGFTNVTYNPIQDCSSTSSYNFNDADVFTIGGNSSFYDYSFFDIDSKVSISYHTVESDYCSNGLEHTYKDSPAVEPTCTESGWTSGTYCTVCNKLISGHTEIPAKGHNKIIDVEASEATCISEGHTEGSHCSWCGEVLSVSESLEINPNHHKHVDIIEAIEPTCILEGRTEGAYCNDCNTVLSVSEILPINSSNHVNTHVISGTPATCITTGISDGLYCDDCKKTVLEQHETPIDSSNHINIIIDAAIPATQTSNGKTQGKHCGDCGAVIVKQETTYWHPDMDWILANKGTEAILKEYYEKNKKRRISVTCRLSKWALYSSYYRMEFVAQKGSVGNTLCAMAVDCDKISNTSKLNSTNRLVHIEVYITDYSFPLHYLYINVLSFMWFS